MTSDPDFKVTTLLKLNISKMARIRDKVTIAHSVLSLSQGFFSKCVGGAVNYSHFLHCVICVFYVLVVLVRLSVPVQMMDWKDSSPK